MVPAGDYTATLESRVEGQIQALAGPVEVEVVPLDLLTLPPEDKAAVIAFQKEVRELRRSVLGASKLADEMDNRIQHLRQALTDTPEVDPVLMATLEELKTRLDGTRLELEGDRTKGQRNVFTPPSIRDRVQRIAYDQWLTTQAPSTTHRKAFEWASEAFATELGKIQVLEKDLSTLEVAAEAAGAPWTPGRVPQ
jgi:hypothetical protein